VGVWCGDIEPVDEGHHPKTTVADHRTLPPALVRECERVVHEILQVPAITKHASVL
jgi:hypothetical protein